MKPEFMLCTPIEEPFNDTHWIFEPKFDGLRVLCEWDGREAHLTSRNGINQNHFFPEIVEALGRTMKMPATLDGEIVSLDENGRSSFKNLQQRFHLLDDAIIQERKKYLPVCFFAFDITRLEGNDLRDLPLARRKALLETVARWNDTIRLTPVTTGKGVGLFAQACKLTLALSSEGIVGKDLRSTYHGDRTGEWVKIKCVCRQEFVIGGFTDPQRSRVGLGALLVGYYKNDKSRLIYAGKVGTGFDTDELLALRAKLEGLEQGSSPFEDGGLSAPGTHWVKPDLIAEIAFAEWTQNGLLRQPRFVGLRPDREARDIRKENSTPGNVVPLDLYRKKRDFSRTREPEPKISESTSEDPIFVIQEHHASHLHYDFRLEEKGVLKSWAVPKSPSLDPGVKRLAVEVEDHPLDYATFEGKIPKGSYGAGTVQIWDHGTYRSLSGSPSEALKEGHLDFVLQGEKLKGAFSLVRMDSKKKGASKQNWLLIKKRDSFARPGGRSVPHDMPQAWKARNAGKARPETSDRLQALSIEDLPPLIPRQKDKAPAKSRIAPRVTSSKTAPGKIQFTHLDKTMFPEIHGTKGDLVSFYESMASGILPFLKDRPITLERWPEGLASPEAPHFWQKNTPRYYPPWIPRVTLPSERSAPVNYNLISNVETLLYLVNQGTLTFHVGFSRVTDLDHPDFVLFDLDPGEAPFSDVVTIAKRLNQSLKAGGLETVIKTSGKSGLHLLVPWKGSGSFDESRAWALSKAQELVSECESIATLARSKKERQNKVYIDIFQNALGHHVIAPYVVRAVPGAAVSMFIDEKELTSRLDPQKFNLRNALKRVQSRLGRELEQRAEALLLGGPKRGKGRRTL